MRGATGTGRDPQEIGGMKGKAASMFPTHLGPGEPAEVLGLILCLPRPPLLATPSGHVGPEGVGGDQCP